MMTKYCHLSFSDHTLGASKMQLQDDDDSDDVNTSIVLQSLFHCVRESVYSPHLSTIPI
jgi:hypothetical protein